MGTNFIISLLVIAVLSTVAEYAFLLIIGASENKKIKGPLRTLCKLLFVCLTIFYLCLLALFCAVTFESIRDGQMETGLKMLLSTIILGTGIYYLLLRNIKQKVF